ncbi:MAG: hypothetical protein J6R96_04020 [Spirochaetaceae bacterium]|nr:hypothetical protein [Spirochaetaceae bacterium]
MAKNKSTVEKRGGTGNFQEKSEKKSTFPSKKEASLPKRIPSKNHLSSGAISARPKASFSAGSKDAFKKSLVEELLPELPVESRQILENFESLVQGVRPLSSRQLLRLPENIRDVSHLLTDQRGGRRMGYLNDTVYLSAYMRYFQWWNLLRLTRLFAGLKPSQLNVPDNGICLDIGSGPLTVPIALWLARPDLREKKLTWYCLDHSQTALSLGEELYLAVAARSIADSALEQKSLEPWRIIRVKGELGESVRQRAHLVTAANVFNEVVEESGKPPEFTAKRAADIIMHYKEASAQVLVVEPGTPPAVRFLTAFRGALARKGLNVVSPCPKGMEWTEGTAEGKGCPCPMDGGRGNKWCHFTFSPEDAPQKLQKLSSRAGLPKERASLAFVLASSSAVNSGVKENQLEIRIISEPIKLPGERSGHYGCCRLGLVLVETATSLAPGALLHVQEPRSPRQDKKSGALVIKLYKS